MVVIKNKEDRLLEFPFDGETYIFGPNETVLVKEELVEHLKILCPLAFDFEAVAPKKKPIRKVRSFKTKSFIEQQAAPSVDMEASGKMTPGWEVSGDGFDGPGVELDSLT